MKYLDPRADLTFKKVFGEHPDLVRSLLNALLPLEEGHDIESVEYLTPEMVPENPAKKYSIVDVRCKDKQGRQFIVEMQMVWSKEFEQRMLFNASKAYVRQLDRNENYELLQPVYALALVNETFEPDMQEYYHYYRMVHEQHTERVINGLHLVFVELPKFQPHSFSEKKMQVLWLRYLTEINEKTKEIDPELQSNAEIKKAIQVVEESAYTEGQLMAYEHFWDMVRVERTLMNSSVRKGRDEGIQQGIERGISIGRAEGEVKKSKEIAINLKKMKFSIADIAKATVLTESEVKAL